MRLPHPTQARDTHHNGHSDQRLGSASSLSHFTDDEDDPSYKAYKEQQIEKDNTRRPLVNPITGQDVYASCGASEHPGGCMTLVSELSMGHEMAFYAVWLRLCLANLLYNAKAK